MRMAMEMKDYGPVLEAILRAGSTFNQHVDNLETDFYRDEALILVDMFFKQKEAVYPFVLQAYRKTLPDKEERGRAAHLAYLLMKIGNKDALKDLIMGLYYPVSSNNSLCLFVLTKAIEAFGNPAFVSRFYQIHDKGNLNYLRPFYTENFQPVKMEKGSIRESLAEMTLQGLTLIPDPSAYRHDITFVNADSVGIKANAGKVIIKFRITEWAQLKKGYDTWYHYQAEILDSESVDALADLK
jgi:hypothetical protein